MKDSTFGHLSHLLEALRAHPALREVRPATFFLHGRSFIHFHEEPDGVFADVLLATGRVHKAVSSADQQAELLEHIHQVLDSLERRQRSRQRRSRKRTGGRGSPRTN